jgi:hypothetical protein
MPHTSDDGTTLKGTCSDAAQRDPCAGPSQTIRRRLGKERHIRHAVDLFLISLALLAVAAVRVMATPV